LVWPTTFQRIEFSARGGDGGVILAKTKTPSDLELEVVLYYKIREEFLKEIYTKYPSQNHHRDYVNIVKVYTFCLKSYRMQY